MKLKKTVFLLLTLLFTTLLPVFVNADQPEAEISIIFTHDMHSHLDPERIVTEGNEMSSGGFARIKTAIDRVSERYPDTFLLDAGDFSMGTPYQTIYSIEAPELRLMGHMNYDAVTIGNHEFDFRAAGLIDMLNAALDSGDKLPTVLIANIDWDRTLADEERAANAGELRKLLERCGNRDYIIVEKGGIKAAVFGIMGKEADSYAPESGMYFIDPIESAKEVVSRIKADGEADIIICLSHSGTSEKVKQSEDEQLAAAVPEIDVIISGHTHTILEQPIVIGNTCVVSCGEYTRQIGHLTLVRDGERYRVSGYEMIPIDGSLTPDPDMSAAITGFRELVDLHYLSQYGYRYDQILAVTDFGFTPVESFGKVQGEDTLGNLIADSYIEAVKQIEGDNYRTVDVAVVPSGVVRGSFAPGAITVADAFNVSSLGIGPDRVPGYPLVSLYLTGKELRTLAEIDISVSTLMSEARLYMSGLSYTYNPHRLLLNRVTGVRLTNRDGSVASELDNDRLYRVVGGLYSCQMMGAVESKSYGLLKVTPKDVNGDPITDFEEHILYDYGHELKEWVVLANYLESFPTIDGVSKIPEYYHQTHGRKVEETSRSLMALIKSPNHIFFMLLGVLALVLILLGLMIFLIVRRIRRKRIKT